MDKRRESRRTGCRPQARLTERLPGVTDVSQVVEQALDDLAEECRTLRASGDQDVFETLAALHSAVAAGVSPSEVLSLLNACVPPSTSACIS
jgi:hypothetical protein